MKRIALAIFTILFLVLLFQSKLYWFSKKPELKKLERIVLVDLAMEALKAKEVPVSSIVIYNGKIIGRGYNTVLRDTNIGGHAEINAISDAIKNIGESDFNKLDRDSLRLITTFEPCLMCRGAIIENRIKQVEFIKEKSVLHWIKNYLKAFSYEFEKKKVDEDNLQDSLFMLHPSYSSNKP